MNNRNILMKVVDKLKLIFKGQGMPKYQNLYLGKGGGKLKVKHGGSVGIVTGCHYEPKLASYIYWLDFNGCMVPVPESYLEETC